MYSISETSDSHSIPAEIRTFDYGNIKFNQIMDAQCGFYPADTMTDNDLLVMADTNKTSDNFTFLYFLKEVDNL